MDKKISVGDLVRIVNVHCDSSKLGTYFVVGRIFNSPWHCKTCRSMGPAESMAGGLSGYQGIPTRFLKRIPPLDELENVEWADKLDVRQPA